jgi:cation transport regulator ChaB
MPMFTNSDLPTSVTSVLSGVALNTFRSLANASIESGGVASVAFNDAWAGLKSAGWEAGNNGMWVKKSHQVEITKSFEFIQKADDKQLVTGIVLEPDTVDAHGDIIEASEIEATAYQYMESIQVVGKQHSEKAEAVVVESYIAPVDFNLGETEESMVKKGTWMMTVKVYDQELWEDIKKGEITGFSIGGYARSVPIPDEDENNSGNDKE